MHDQLIAGLEPLARRLRLRTSISGLVQTAWLALGATALFLLLSRAVPIENYVWIAAAIVGVWFTGWLGYTFLHRRTAFQVAQRADEELVLRDRIATALTFSNPDAMVSANSDPELVARQQQDALAHLQRIEPREAFPIQLNRRLGGAALIALAVIGALVFLPNPMDAVIAERREIVKAAQEQAKELEELAKAVEENKNLNPKDQEQLLKKLRELAAQLRANPGDAKKALADISKLQEVLNNSFDLNKQGEAAALDTLASQMAQVANASETLKDTDELAKLLEELANSESLSAEERAAMVQTLAQAAAQVAAGNPELANALTELAHALSQNASGSELQQTAARAASALQDAGEQQALQQALAQASNQADASQRAMARAANSSPASDGQQLDQDQGRGQGQGQGQGQGGQGQGQAQGGQGQGQGGQGQGQGGQGQVQGTGQGQGQVGGGVIGGGGGGGTGRVGGPNGQNKPFGADDVSTVYTPFQTGQKQQENVGGQDSGSGQTTTRQDRSPLPGALNPAVVPYTQVLQQYTQIAGQAMENSYIPSGMKDYVKEYFSALEP